MDWFLYDNGLRHERVKVFFESESGVRYDNHIILRCGLTYISIVEN